MFRTGVFHVIEISRREFEEFYPDAQVKFLMARGLVRDLERDEILTRDDIGEILRSTSDRTRAEREAQCLKERGPVMCVG